ncbi:hypothetical protein ZWY2020_015650 [Hordeum vulgare]|nr:hypothetical protein ZWY2020_015650 [Hordeum vulgare]
MSGDAEDQSQTSDNARLDPAILDHRHHSPPRVLPSRHGFQEMASLPIPNELVQEILLRLPTLADLVRASASCPSFRLLISCHSFLRRLRKLHTPPLLGFLSPSRKFFRVIMPSPSASAASAADISFSFLPGGENEAEKMLEQVCTASSST